MASSPGDVIIVIGTVIILGQEMLNVFDLRLTGSGTYTDVQLSAAVRMWMNRAYDGISAGMTDTADFNKLEIRGRTQPSLNIITTWDTTGFSTGSPGDVLPAGVSALVTFPTNAQKTRGRKYIMGFTESYCTAGLWTGAAITMLTDFATNVINVLAPAGSNPGLEYVVVKDNGLAWTAYRPSAGLVRDIPAYQRRRRQGVGI